MPTGRTFQKIRRPNKLLHIITCKNVGIQREGAYDIAGGGGEENGTFTKLIPTGLILSKHLSTSPHIAPTGELSVSLSISDKIRNTTRSHS
jgi:hypothetical protein